MSPAPLARSLAVAFVLLAAGCGGKQEATPDAAPTPAPAPRGVVTQAGEADVAAVVDEANVPPTIAVAPVDEALDAAVAAADTAPPALDEPDTAAAAVDDEPDTEAAAVDDEPDGAAVAVDDEPGEPAADTVGEAIGTGVVEGVFAIKDQAFTTSVESGEPAGRASRFSLADEKIYVWFEVDAEEAAKITVTWRKGDEDKHDFGLDLGVSPRWRTWAVKKIGKRDAGAWFADVKTEDGTVVASYPFTIAEPEAGE